MSAALKPSPPKRYRPRAAGSGPTAKTAPSVLPPVHPILLSQPQPRHLQAVTTTPRWSGRTRLLAAVNTGMSAIAGLLVTSALGGYSYTVYIDRQLDQSSTRLETLQRSEQQLTTVNEVLKNHMAKEAEGAGAGLQPPQPTNVIFLKPAQQRTLAQPSPPAAAARSPQALPPLGY